MKRQLHYSNPYAIVDGYIEDFSWEPGEQIKESKMGIFKKTDTWTATPSEKFWTVKDFDYDQKYQTLEEAQAAAKEKAVNGDTYVIMESVNYAQIPRSLVKVLPVT